MMTTRAQALETELAHLLGQLSVLAEEQESGGTVEHTASDLVAEVDRLSVELAVELARPEAQDA